MAVGTYYHYRWREDWEYTMFIANISVYSSIIFRRFSRVFYLVRWWEERWVKKLIFHAGSERIQRPQRIRESYKISLAMLSSGMPSATWTLGLLINKCIKYILKILDSISGSKNELNLDYIPHLRNVLSRPLINAVSFLLIIWLRCSPCFHKLNFRRFFWMFFFQDFWRLLIKSFRSHWCDG